jgi:hypothetical protein
MSLFVVEHHHASDSCPLAPHAHQELFAHITAANASRQGITILAEAVPTGQHRLLLILDAVDANQVEHFLAFLIRYGTLQICPAQSAETASAHGGCADGR